MQHIRNSIKGVFFLENEGIPTTTTTNFAETIPNGSLCVDKTNQDLYILKSNIWLLVGSSGLNSTSGITPIIESNYNQLETDKNNNDLKPGQLYSFDHQTIHQITNTLDINIGNTEKLIVRAISGSNFHSESYSEDFPSDIIHYDFNDNLVEDSITDRTGKITYRKDIENGLETYYDFRNVLFRRWDISASTNDTWAITTLFNENDSVIYNNDLYKCVKTHTSGATFDTDMFMVLFKNIDSNSYLWDSTSILIGNVIIFADTTFNNYYTFETDCFDISISKYDTYNNIVFNSTSGCSNISIGNNSFDMNILASGLEISSDCSDISINENCIDININKNSNISIGESSNNINIKDNSFNIAIDNSQQVEIGFNCNNITIDNTIDSTIKSSCNNITIGDSSNNVLVSNSCNDIYMGSYNNIISIGDNSSGFEILNENSVLNIGSDCNNISISGTNNHNHLIGSNVSNYTCVDSNDNISIDDNNDNITLGSDIFSIDIGNNGSDFNILDNCNNIKIGNTCNTITMNTNSIGNIFKNNVSNIILPTACSNNLFGNSCSNITLQVGASNNSFVSGVSDKTFSSAPSGMRFMITDTNSQTYTNTFTNIVADMIDSNNDIWYNSIDTFGTITTIKME